MADQTEIQSALGATLAGQILSTAGTPQVIVPEGFELHDLEKTLSAPLRLRGSTKVLDAKSFIALVTEFKGPGTKLYGNFTPPKFAAVFNANASYLPGWSDHRVTYDCPISIEWTTWVGANKRTMSQPDFAQFIEDNLPDLLDAATMLEVSRTLEAKKKVNFASGIRLSDGETQFTYEEQIEGTASKGLMKVPEVFQIGIPVFEGGDRYKVNARLRYRIGDGGKLTLWYDLERPHKILEDAVKEVWTSIETGTELVVLNAVI